MAIKLSIRMNKSERRTMALEYYGLCVRKEDVVKDENGRYPKMIRLRHFEQSKEPALLYVEDDENPLGFKLRLPDDLEREHYVIKKWKGD